MALLYEHEGFTDALSRTFLVYTACTGRPPHEIIDPHILEIDQAFAQKFDGMPLEHAPLTALLAARERLVADIRDRIDPAAADFLLFLQDGVPGSS